jgi:4-hydroxybutyrate dehydrogenase
MVNPVATFTFPTAVLYGPGTLAELPARLKQMGCRRPLVVTDPGLLQTKAFQSLREALGSQQLGQTWDLFHEVHTNPTEHDVIEAARAYREASCDSVVAFGGGSAMDVGKVLRLLLKHPEMKLSQYDLQADWSGLARFVCIPTTAGTGSEVGRSAVVTLGQTESRSTVFLPRLLAKLVILDPTLTVELPAALTAATGLDALTHCIESFTSPVFQPFCDGVALEGIYLIRRTLPTVVQNGQDLQARGTMQVAAAMGGLAFQKDLGATHSLAHPLSAMCGMHHGTANAVCLPHVMEWNARHKPGLYRRVGLAFGLDVVKLKDAEADAKTIQFLKKFIARLGLAGKLSAYGVKPAQIDALATQASADSCHLTNPVPVTREDLKALYLAAL